MLQVDDLKLSVASDAGPVLALDGISWTLKRGETLALVGETGCGKSLTALALMRLLPQGARVAGGSVHLDGVDVLGLPEAQMRALRGGRMAMVFQEPASALNPLMRVGEQVLESIETHTPLRGAAARRRAIEWLARVGIPEPEKRANDYPFQLSGGQKQRVMIAVTLAGEPDYLIADEPTTALDVGLQAQILALLKDLQVERRLGLLLITHDLGVVARMAHRVALMYAGQLLETASAADFFAAPRHPYAQLLLRALPGAAQRARPLSAIEGSVPPLGSLAAACRFAPRCPQVQPRCQSTAPELRRCGDATEASAEPSHQVRCLRAAESALQFAAQGRGMLAGLSAGALSDSSQGSLGGQGAARPLLQVKSLSVAYPRRRALFAGPAPAPFKAVDGLSFTLDAGRTLALVGESGSGKSSVGKALVQLLRGRAVVQGEALLDGQDLFKLQGAALLQARRAIQLIFQDPMASLNPRMRVRELLEEGLIALRPEWDAGARLSRMQRLLIQVGLGPEALSRHPHEFSGGQRQRIAIARALAVEPRVLVCDEPTSALDVSVQAQILNLLKSLQQEQGLAYLFITHNLGVVEYFADEVLVMQKGRMVEMGACEALRLHPQQPYTQALWQAERPVAVLSR